jgi:hypothetical protein
MQLVQSQQKVQTHVGKQFSLFQGKNNELVGEGWIYEPLTDGSQKQLKNQF